MSEAKRVIRLIGFKKSGKYYSEFEVRIPAETPEFGESHAVYDAIKGGDVPQDLIYMGKTSGFKVPFLVNTV